MVGIVPGQFGGVELAVQFLLHFKELAEPVAQCMHCRAGRGIAPVLCQQQYRTVHQKFIEGLALGHLLVVLFLEDVQQVRCRRRQSLAHQFRCAGALYVPEHAPCLCLQFFCSLFHQTFHLGAELPHLGVVGNGVALLVAPLHEVLFEDALCKVFDRALYVPSAVLVQFVRNVLHHYLSERVVYVQRVNHAVHG